jgi:hypothetical protein
VVTTLIAFMLLLVGLGGAALVVLIIRGTRTDNPMVADHLAFVDDRDHSDEELMEIYGIDRQGAQYAFGTMALFDTLEGAIAYARTVPPHSRPKRRSGAGAAMADRG